MCKKQAMPVKQYWLFKISIQLYPVKKEADGNQFNVLHKSVNLMTRADMTWGVTVSSPENEIISSWNGQKQLQTLMAM